MASRTKNTEPLRGPGTVVGLFRDQPQAGRAIRELKTAGFSDNQIGVLMQDPEAGRQLAEDTGTKAGEGAKAGALGGGVVGGLLGLLAGVGALAIPGIGPIIAGGALASTLAGAGIGAAAGGLLGALMGMGIPEEEARYYERGLQEGGILVTVNAGDRALEAEQVLSGAGAEFGRGRAVVGEEQVQVERTPTVNEELTVGKRRVTDTPRVRDTLRREEARVEETDRANARTEGELAGEAWRGNERRYRDDASYAGPERRMARL